MNELAVNQLRGFDPQRKIQLPRSTAHRRFREGPSCVGGKFWRRECHRYSKYIGIGTIYFWRAGVARKTFSIFASIDNHDAIKAKCNGLGDTHDTFIITFMAGSTLIPGYFCMGNSLLASDLADSQVGNQSAQSKASIRYLVSLLFCCLSLA